MTELAVLWYHRHGQHHVELTTPTDTLPRALEHERYGATILGYQTETETINAADWTEYQTALTPTDPPPTRTRPTRTVTDPYDARRTVTIPDHYPTWTGQ